MTRRLSQQIGLGKFLLLWGISLLFGLSERNGLPSLSLHVLAVLNDQYYFVFAILPVILFFCGGVMEDDAEIVILRHGCYARYFAAKWRVLVLLSAVLWLGQMAVLTLTGWGYPLAGGWPDLSGIRLWQEVFALLKMTFPRPEIALLCAAVHLLVGYWLIALLTLWLGHFLPRNRAIQVLMALYALAVFQIKLPVMSRPPLMYLTGLSRWVLLLHNLTEPWRFTLTVIVTLLFLAVVVYTVRNCWRRQLLVSRRTAKGLFPYYRRILFSKNHLLLAAVLIVLLTGWFWLRSDVPETGREWVVRLLAGHGTGEFYPMGLLSLLLAEVLPLWPLGSLISQAVSQRSVYLSVRLRRRQEMLSALFRTALAWLAFWGVLLLAAEILPVLLLNLQPDWPLTIWTSGLRLLDMGLQFLLLFTILCCTGQTAVGFLGVVLLHFLCVLPLPWLPVGLSSLLRLNLPETGGTVPPAFAAAGLMVGCAILLAWLYVQGVGRLFEKNGG